MGFVATTLSICDPVGTLQRRIVKTPKLIKLEEPLELNLESVELEPVELFQSRSIKSSYSVEALQKWLHTFLIKMIFGRLKISHFSVLYVFAIIYSPC